MNIGDIVTVKARIIDELESSARKSIQILDIDGNEVGSYAWVKPQDLSKTYEDGITDMMNAIKEVYDMTCDEVYKVFGCTGGMYDVITKYSPQEIIDKIVNPEDKDEFKKGDEVYSVRDKSIGIVLNTYISSYEGLIVKVWYPVANNVIVYNSSEAEEKIEKTGKNLAHILDFLLKELKDN